MNQDAAQSTFHLSPTVKWVAASIAGTTASIWGGFGAAVKALIILMVLDYLTGWCAAIVQRNWDSGIGLRGIAKKAVMLLLVTGAHVCDKYLGAEMLGTPGGTVLSTIFAGFLAGNEFGSIIENAIRAGVPIPDQVVSILAKFRHSTTTNKPAAPNAGP